MNKIFFLFVIFIASQASFAQKDCGAATASQRAAFVSLPASEKVRLWKEHLHSELETRSLTSGQRRLIVSAADMLSEGFYAESAREDFNQTPFGQKFAKFNEQIKANFSLKDGAEIFERLPNFKTTVTANRANECNCSTTWTFCGGGDTCSTGCWSCTSCSQIINCGPFWGFTCNGKCYPELT